VADDGGVGFDAEGELEFVFGDAVEGDEGLFDGFDGDPDPVAFFEGLADDFDVFFVFDAVAHDEAPLVFAEHFEDDVEFGFGPDFKSVVFAGVEDSMDGGESGVDLHGVDSAELPSVFLLLDGLAEDAGDFFDLSGEELGDTESEAGGASIASFSDFFADLMDDLLESNLAAVQGDAEVALWGDVEEVEIIACYAIDESGIVKSPFHCLNLACRQSELSTYFCVTFSPLN
jgi:hypothetical protein